MKKNYLIPEAEWMLLLSQDIITESDDDTGGDIFNTETDNASTGYERDDVIEIGADTFTPSAN